MQKTKNPSCPLAIVGIGCLFPQADNVADYWRNIREGVDAITDIPESHWDPADYFDNDQKKPDMTYARRGGFINPVDFDPLQYGISPNDIEATDTTQLLGMVIARQALLDAGYSTFRNAGDGKEFDRDRASVIMGVTSALELLVPLSARLGHPIWRQALADAGVNSETAEDVVQRIADSYVPWKENSFPGLLGNVVAGRIANRFDLGGTNCVVDAACASSLSAIHLAAMELETGRADIVITGGVDTFNDIFMYMCFSKTPALSPTGNSRPFASDGDGTILGEGIGAVILKRLEDAQRDGDKIHAVIKGIGSSSDGRGNAIYAPNAAGQVKALQQAYMQAGVEPDSIELIEAHGTGTVVGDAVEVEALQQVYRKNSEQQPWCAIGSVKSMIGHTKAAAGIAGMIKTVMALKHQVLPPSIKVGQPLELLVGNIPLYLNTIKRPWVSSHSHPRRAALSAFGFGGSNFHCVLEEAEDGTNAVEYDGQVLLFALSTTSKEQLLEQLTAIKTDRLWPQQRAWAALSCIKFDSSQPHRMVLVIEKDSTDLAALIQEATELLSQPEKQSDPYFQQLASGISYASGSHQHKTGLLFPGQGAQYVGMFRDLACQYPQFRDILSTANAVQGEHQPGSRLSDIIYPIPVFSGELEKQQQDILRDTRNAQPAIGAVSLAALRVLEQFDFEADIIAGHSYGELVALCAAGIFEEHVLHQLSQLRGKLMSQNDGDVGAMLAVFATLEQVRQLIGEGQLDVTVANHNAPEQIVLSGASDQISNARTFFKQHKVVSKPLPVAAAFHSEFVASAEQPFMEALAEIELHDSKKTVLSNTTAGCYPSEQQQIKELLAGQLARPVRFVEQIERMYAMGVRTFVEVGPGGRLSGLVNSILKGKGFQMLIIDASAGKRHGQHDLAAMLASLAVLGKIDLSPWDRDYAASQSVDKQPEKKSMHIKLSGANYVTPREKRPPRAMQSKTQTMIATDDQQKLSTVHENIIALQKMQEQTARLHQQYLEGQQVAQQTIAQMLQQIASDNILSLPAAIKYSPAVLTPETPTQTAQTLAQAEIPVSTEPSRAKHQETAQLTQTEEEVSNILLKIIADKTGYPSEMLNLDMSLDNDLGIDSIKRVEILSALQERLPDIPIVDPEKLGTFESLQDIAKFLSATASPTSLPDTSLPSGDGDNSVRHQELQQILLEVIADKTGYPSEMLNLDMSLDNDLGIDSIKRVEILSALREKLPQTPDLSAEDLGTLQTLQQITEYISNTSGLNTEELDTHNSVVGKLVSSESVPDKSVPRELAIKPAENQDEMGITMAQGKLNKDNSTLSNTLQRQVLSAVSLKESGYPISLLDGAKIAVLNAVPDLAHAIKKSLVERGLLVEVIAMDAAADPVWAGLIITVPKKPDKNFIKDSFLLVQKMNKSLRQAGKLKAAILVSVTQLGGRFGLHGTGNACPISGGIAGLIKTAAREWPEVSCKAIDIGNSDKLDELASSIVDECLTAGPVEIGLSLNDQSIIERFTLQLNTTEIDIQAAVARPLQSGDVIVVTGGARGVTAEIALALAKTYRTNLLLFGRSKEPDPEAEWLKGMESEEQIKKAIISEKTRQGIKSTMISPRIVESIYRKILAERDIRNNLRRLAETDVKVMYRVVDVQNKADVIANIAEARKFMGEINGIVHGAGVLADRLIEDKTEEQFSLVYDTKVDGITALLVATENDPLKIMIMFSSSTARFGRVGQCDYAIANEVLNKIAQQQAVQRQDCRVLSINWGPWDGGMVTPALKKIFDSEGIGLIPLPVGVDYLMQEIVYQGPTEIVILGNHEKDARNKPSASPKTISTVPVNNSQISNVPTDNMSVVLTLKLNTTDYPFLRSHIMNNRAVLPAAMIIEWLIHGALHNNPNLICHGLKNFHIFKGVTLELEETVELNILVDQAGNDLSMITMEMRHEKTLNARAEIILSADNYQTDETTHKNIIGQYSQAANKIYSSGRLFHGDMLHGIQSITGCNASGISAWVKTATAPGLWMKTPIRSYWLTDPLVLDSSFQMMILWSFEQSGKGSLPTAVSEYRQFRKEFPQQGCQINISITEHSEHRALADVEFIDKNDQLIARIKGYECVIDDSLQDVFGKNEPLQEATINLYSSM